mgnify:CR=1 FL=1
MLVCLACFENRLASVLENATELRLYREAEGGYQPAGHLSLPAPDEIDAADASGVNGADRTAAIGACGVDVLVCGAVCGCTRRMLERAGVTVLPWLRGEVDEVLRALAEDRLDALAMPGCRNQGAGGMGRGKGMQGRGANPMSGRCRNPGGPWRERKNDTGGNR